jgi:hypothetical protein
MSAMCIEDMEEGGSFVHQSNACMGASVNVTEVTLWELEGAFDVHVVEGKAVLLEVGEQTGREAFHGLPEMNPNGIGILAKDVGVSDEHCFALLRGEERVRK